MTVITQLQVAFLENADESAAVMMKKYMKDQFCFLGLSKPIRTNLQKQFIKETKKFDTTHIISLAEQLSDMQYREFYYTGIDLLKTSVKKLDIVDIYRMTELAVSQNPWWDSVDAMNIAIKNWFALGDNSRFMGEYIHYALDHDSMWANRLSLICQLQMKDSLDTELLEDAVHQLKDSDEFFIRKAIGWILREYSKYNPDYVRSFLHKNTLNPLSVREASKYI